jgi:dsDNA-specific endonuclease/ATPase MutS2
MPKTKLSELENRIWQAFHNNGQSLNATAKALGREREQIQKVVARIRRKLRQENQ